MKDDATPAEPLTDEQIELGRRETFSTDNPFCPCDSKTMRKAVRWAERAHGIGVRHATPAVAAEPTEDITIDESDLLPCPFCGGDAGVSIGTKAGGLPWHYIECDECSASAEPDVWNRRAAIAHPAATAVCVPAGWTLMEDGVPPLGVECIVQLRPLRGNAEPFYVLDTWNTQREAPVAWSSATIETGDCWDSNDVEDVIAWMVRPSFASPAASTAGATPETPGTLGVSPSGPGSLSQAPTIPDAACEERSGVTIPERIGELIAEHGTLHAVARAIKRDVGYLSRLSREEKENPSDDLLSDLGLVRVTRYERAQTEH